MARRRQRRTPEVLVAARAAERAARVAALRDGRRQRAATFTDRRKEASRRACRQRVR